MVSWSQEEQATLRRLMRTAPQPHLRVKATALWNLGVGRRASEVAAFLGVSRGSLRNWVRRFAAEGAAGLAVRPGRGRPSRADPAEVEAYVRQSPRGFGLLQTRWTLRALAQTVPSLRGFTDMGVAKVLHRLGFRYKRGQPQLHSPDPEYGEKRGAWRRSSRRPPPAQRR